MRLPCWRPGGHSLRPLRPDQLLKCPQQRPQRLRLQADCQITAVQRLTGQVSGNLLLPYKALQQ